MFATPFIYFASLSVSGLVLAGIIHIFGWFTAPERVISFFDKDS